MTKATPIDRLELTRKKFKHLQHELHEHDDTGLKVCPNCGAKSLRLDGGCMSCLACGWSACRQTGQPAANRPACGRQVSLWLTGQPVADRSACG